MTSKSVGHEIDTCSIQILNLSWIIATTYKCRPCLCSYLVVKKGGDDSFTCILFFRSMVCVSIFKFYLRDKYLLYILLASAANVINDSILSLTPFEC